MKRIRIILLTLLAILLMSSECGRPDMLVINKVNQDGSIKRTLVITYDEDEFVLQELQVPVDSSWIIEKTIDLSEKGDTIWTLTAEKYFASVDELNYSYRNNKSINDKMERSAIFDKRFRWFNTSYYFSENVEKAIDGYPPEDFFDNEYLELFYMPEKIYNDYRYGPDSLKYKAMNDTLEERKELWIGRSLVRDAILEFDSLQSELGSDINIEKVWEKEEVIGETIFEMDEEEAIDSLLGEGFYQEHKVLIDSALAKVEDDFNIALEAVAYHIQTSMPGDIVGTNGYIDTDGAIIWEVDGDSILSRDYEMWAESTVSNTWAWIVSGVFLLFVALSFIIGVRRS